MNGHTDKIFRWLDILRWALYGLMVGAASIAIWCTKIQMTVTDLEKRMNDMQQNTQIHRDALKQKEVDSEHRLTRIEQWILDHNGNMP